VSEVLRVIWVVIDVQDTSNVLCDQSMSADDVPLLIDKCINFVATYGNLIHN